MSASDSGGAGAGAGPASQNDGESREDILAITPHIVGLLEEWRLDGEQIANILALEGKVSLRAMRGYRTSSRPLPLSSESMERIRHIAGISSALHTSYPFSSAMQVMWLHQPHRRFRGLTPMQLMLSEGLDGIMRVRVEVDCAWGWQCAEKQMDKSGG